MLTLTGDIHGLAIEEAQWTEDTDRRLGEETAHLPTGDHWDRKVLGRTIFTLRCWRLQLLSAVIAEALYNTKCVSEAASTDSACSNDQKAALLSLSFPGKAWPGCWPGVSCFSLGLYTREAMGVFPSSLHAEWWKCPLWELLQEVVFCHMFAFLMARISRHRSEITSIHYSLLLNLFANGIVLIFRLLPPLCYGQWSGFMQAVLLCCESFNIQDMAFHTHHMTFDEFICLLFVLWFWFSYKADCRLA